MNMRGTSPRALTVGGSLAVFALGALLLPLIPSWAQSPPATPSGYLQPPSRDPSQPADPFLAKRRELERAQQEIKKMLQDSEMARRDLEKRTQDLHTRALELHVMMERLQKEALVRDKEFLDFNTEKKEALVRDKKEALVRDKVAPVGRAGPKPGESVVPMPPDMDKRLRDVERKLDILIDMMNRKQPKPPPTLMQPTRIAPMVPGAAQPGTAPADPLFGEAPLREKQPILPPMGADLTNPPMPPRIVPVPQQNQPVPYTPAAP